MEGSDETGVIQRIQSSFGNCSPSSVIIQGNDQNHDIKRTNNHVELGINCEMQNIHVVENSYGRRSVGIPPSHPYTHFDGQKLGNFTVKPSHSRSLSQPSFVFCDQLPPLIPCVSRESPTMSFDRVLNGAYNVQGHWRSISDVPLGLDTHTMSGQPVQLVIKREGKGEMDDNDLASTYMNFERIDALNSSSMEDKDSRVSGTRTNESSENDGESSGISSNSVERRDKGSERSVPGDIVSTCRHSRSLSMDSFMGNLSLNGEESPRVTPSLGIRSAQHSRNNSMDGSTSLFSFDFGSAQFSPEELKKIMANEKLAEVARADPRRVKRILANRVSAARSKERKVRYIAELEYKVQTLQTEATSLSAQLTFLQRDSVELATQNNELRFRLQAMQEQAQLRDALNETLGAEVQRLRIAAEMRGICLPQ